MKHSVYSITVNKLEIRTRLHDSFPAKLDVVLHEHYVRFGNRAPLLFLTRYRRLELIANELRKGVVAGRALVSVASFFPFSCSICVFFCTVSIFSSIQTSLRLSLLRMDSPIAAPVHLSDYKQLII